MNEIEICLGSSCFSRGNKEIKRSIDDFLQNNSLTNKVKFKGAHCFGDCNLGPLIRINGKAYERVNSSNIHLILNEAFQDLL